jgi:hypothetical protein
MHTPPGAPQTRGDMNELVIVEHAGNEAMADLIKQRLDQAGIPCLIAPTALGAVSGAGAGYAISVAPDHADAARELLGEVDAT